MSRARPSFGNAILDGAVAGEIVLITDDDRVVAQLGPPAF